MSTQTTLAGEGLTRNLGVTGIVLMVVAAAAPITVVVANFPIILLVSGSVGAPLMIIAAAVILLLFSVGYAGMTPHRSRRGVARPALLRAPDRLHGVLSRAAEPQPPGVLVRYRRAVVAIGVLYTVSSWLVISGLGVRSAVSVSTADPDGAVIDLAGQVVAPIMADAVQVLVVSSMSACMLAFHNIVARYVFTLGQRGVLPAALGSVHAQYRAPSLASILVTGITSVIVLVSAGMRLDPVTQIYAWYSGAGAVGVILMMFLTSIAIAVYRLRPHGDGGGPSRGSLVLVSALLGAAGLLGVLAISLVNLPALVGSGTAAVICGGVLALVFALGLLAPRRRTLPAPPVEPDRMS